MLFTVMVIFHTIVCILLVITVLMQSAKGEGLAGAFGGGGGLSGAVFGGRGAATFLSKATTVLAIVFFVNCGILAFMSANRTGGGTSATSAVTEEAQREIERRQAQQDMLPTDTTVMPTEGATDEQVPAVPATETGN